MAESPLGELAPVIVPSGTPPPPLPLSVVTYESSDVGHLKYDRAPKMEDENR